MLKFTDIKDRAKKMGIKPGRLGKKELIHKIQIKEGNEPCFDSGIRNCEQNSCYWREFCIKN